MKANNKLFGDFLIVTTFWWTVFTVLSFMQDPGGTFSALFDAPKRVYWWSLGIVSGAFIGWWVIWFGRLTMADKLRPSSWYGINTSLGDVPLLAKEPKRVIGDEIIPITSKVVQAWLDRNKETNPHHVSMFMAMWQILSAHRHVPASPYKNGHGGRMLWEHSLNVVEESLVQSTSWLYEGVFFKKRGKKRVLIIPKLISDFKFDPTDPLIPVIALAHDLGKVEVYKVNQDGTVESKEEGAGPAKHARVSAQILARIPEWWDLHINERRIIARAVMHYHDPMRMPIDKSGAAIDDRTASLMQFLIDMDNLVGEKESGMAKESGAEISAEESAGIFRAFVEIVTEFGRINGTGNPETDRFFKVGQKHDGLIFVREDPLRKLILRKLGLSLVSGPQRYKPTLSLLATLEEKGLLHAVHNGVNFGRFLPMHTVSFFKGEDGECITTWRQVIIFRVTPAEKDLAPLGSLPNFDSVARVDGQYYGHNPNIVDHDLLKEMMRTAFGDASQDVNVFDDTQANADEDAAVASDAAPVAVTPPASPIAPTPTAVDSTLDEPDPEEELNEYPTGPDVLLDSMVTTPKSKSGKAPPAALMSNDDLFRPADEVPQIHPFTDSNRRSDRKAPVSPASSIPQSGDSNARLPMDAVMKTIVDPEVPKTPPFDSKREKEALRSLQALREQAEKGTMGFTPVPHRPKLRTKPADAGDSLSVLKELVNSGKVPVLHTHEAIRYVERSAMESAAPDIDIGDLINSKRVRALTLAGISALGIPE